MPRSDDDEHHGHDHHGNDVNRHDERIRAFCITRERPISWSALSGWLDALATMRGDDLLRLKAIVALADRPEQPVVLHGVQHLFHPPVLLPAWPDADRRTRIVFITRDLPRDDDRREPRRLRGGRRPGHAASAAASRRAVAPAAAPHPHPAGGERGAQRCTFNPSPGPAGGGGRAREAWEGEGQARRCTPAAKLSTISAPVRRGRPAASARRRRRSRCCRRYRPRARR